LFKDPQIPGGSLGRILGMGWGTMMSPALWQLESDRLPQKGVSRLGSELYGDDNLEADLNKVQTKKLSS